MFFRSEITSRQHAVTIAEKFHGVFLGSIDSKGKAGNLISVRERKQQRKRLSANVNRKLKSPH